VVYAALQVLVNAVYAVEFGGKTPMIVTASRCLDLGLTGVSRCTWGGGHRGLAFSTACIATSNFLILYFLRPAIWAARSGLGALLLRLAAASACLAADLRSPRTFSSPIGQPGLRAETHRSPVLLLSSSS